MSHYTKKREEKTKDLLERVLDVLVYADEPIELNGKEYKKINFSQGQVVEALKHYATPQEQIDGVVIRDASTISKNDQYKLMISGAKIKRTETALKDSDFSSSEKRLTETEMKVKVDRLIYEKEMLAEENRMLKDVIKQADIEDFLEGGKPKVHESISIDSKLIALLEKVLVLMSRDASVVVEKKEKGKAAQIFYYGLNGSEFLCYADDLKGLNIDFGTDRKGRFILQEKRLING